MKIPPALQALSWLGLASLAAGAESRSAAPPDPVAGVIVPTKPILLFNGKDLAPFYTWLVDHQFNDPNQVFRVVERVDGAPAIRVSGENWGVLVTKAAYANYHLVVEYRWGLLTWGRRLTRAMDSGILVHGRGREGASSPDFNGPWMNSIECQLIEGGTGDFIRVRGHDQEGRVSIPSLTGTARRLINGKTVWDPKGETLVFGEGGAPGRLSWSGHDPYAKDELGFRGIQDVEKPVGQWNRIELICRVDTITIVLNGQVINQATQCSLTAGKILFQSEGAEVFFRRIELHPLR